MALRLAGALGVQRPSRPFRSKTAYGLANLDLATISDLTGSEANHLNESIPSCQDRDRRFLILADCRRAESRLAAWSEMDLWGSPEFVQADTAGVGDLALEPCAVGLNNSKCSLNPLSSYSPLDAKAMSLPPVRSLNVRVVKTSPEPA